MITAENDRKHDDLFEWDHGYKIHASTKEERWHVGICIKWCEEEDAGEWSRHFNNSDSRKAYRLKSRGRIRECYIVPVQWQSQGLLFEAKKLRNISRVSLFAGSYFEPLGRGQGADLG